MQNAQSDEVGAAAWRTDHYLGLALQGGFLPGDGAPSQKRKNWDVHSCRFYKQPRVFFDLHSEFLRRKDDERQRSFCGALVFNRIEYRRQVGKGLARTGLGLDKAVFSLE